MFLCLLGCFCAFGGCFCAFWGCFCAFGGCFCAFRVFLAFHASARFFLGSFFFEGLQHRNGEFPLCPTAMASQSVPEGPWPTGARWRVQTKTQRPWPAVGQKPLAHGRTVEGTTFYVGSCGNGFRSSIRRRPRLGWVVRSRHLTHPRIRRGLCHWAGEPAGYLGADSPSRRAAEHASAKRTKPPCPHWLRGLSQTRRVNAVSRHRRVPGASELGGGRSPLETDEGQNPAPGASQAVVMAHY